MLGSHFYEIEEPPKTPKIKFTARRSDSHLPNSEENHSSVVMENMENVQFYLSSSNSRWRTHLYKITSLALLYWLLGHFVIRREDKQDGKLDIYVPLLCSRWLIGSTRSESAALLLLQQTLPDSWSSSSQQYITQLHLRQTMLARGGGTREGEAGRESRDGIATWLPIQRRTKRRFISQQM